MITPVQPHSTESAPLRETAQAFEAVFAQMLMKSMRSTVGKSGLFHGGRGEDLYSELLDQAFAQAAARRGGGFGIAELIQRQIARSAYAG